MLRRSRVRGTREARLPLARAGPGPLGGSAVASSAGATFRWAGVGRGQHQSWDRPQLLPRGPSRALGPGLSCHGETGHCTRLAFHSKGTLFPAGPRVLAHEAAPRLALKGLLPGSLAGRARTQHAAAGDAHCVPGAGGPGDRLPCTWLCLWRPPTAWGQPNSFRTVLGTDRG